MNKWLLFVEEYSYHIPLLLNKKREGRVHSVFANGFNIVMDGSLVFIGNKKNGLLPFGIHLQEEDIDRAVSLVTNGESVFWNERMNSLEFSAMSISIKKGKSFKNEVTPLKSNRAFQIGFDRLRSQLTTIEAVMGLDVDINLFLTKFEAGVDQKWLGSEPKLLQLIEAMRSSDDGFIERTLRFFIGRGMGLTPSGDDLIVGLLAFDSISKMISEQFYLQLGKLLEEPITTDVGREYLQYAFRHEFSSTVTDVVNSMDSRNQLSFNEAFLSLLGVGHSSGLDTLFGILIGMLAFKNL